MLQHLNVIRRFTSRKKHITLINPTSVLFAMENLLSSHLFCDTKSFTTKTSLTNAGCVVKGIDHNLGKFNTR